MKQASDDIARESDKHRANVSGLIDELRDRLSAGEVIDEVLSSETLHQFIRNFGNQVKSNPVALTMIGGGLAWLIFSGAKSGVSAGDDASLSLSDVKDKMADMAVKAQEAASDAAADAKGYRQKVREAANDAADRGAAFLKKTKSGETLDRWAREQPLLMAGVGLALGVLVGAGVPLSDAENDLMGEESDRFRSHAAEMAHDGISKTKEATQAGYAAARETFRGSQNDLSRSDGVETQYH